MKSLLKFSLGFLGTILWFFMLAGQSQIEEDGYSQFPKLFQLDNYDECMKDNQGLYCLLDIEITSDGPSELLNKIKNVSAKRDFFRHDILHRGVCVSRRCSISGIPLDSLLQYEEPLKSVLRGCALPLVDPEGVPEPALKGTVIAAFCTNKRNEKESNITTSMFLYATVIYFILIAVTASSIYITEENMDEGNWFRKLYCFNIPNNWKILKGQWKTEDSWMEGLQGIRIILMSFVIMSHFYVILYHMYLENPEELEKLHAANFFRFIFRSILLVQIYFSLSSFLLTYSLLKQAGRHPNMGVFSTFLKAVVLRWLRLTPAYAVVLGFVTLWLGRLAKGPMSLLAYEEVSFCTDSWWANLLYVHNLVGSVRCMPQTWYLSVDTQYYCVSLVIIMLIFKFPGAAKSILGVTLLTGVLIPGVITYIRNYPALPIITPECIREACLNLPDVMDLYISFMGNIPSPAIGILGGYMQYYIEKNDIDISKKKWFSVALKAVIPGLLGVMAVGVGLYQNADTTSPLMAAIHASLSKAIVSSLFVILYIGIANKCDLGLLNFIKSKTLEIPGTLSYSVLLVHILVLATILSSLQMPIHLRLGTLFWLPIAAILISYAVGLVLFMFVELPFKNLLKQVMSGEKQIQNGVTGKKSISRKVKADSQTKIINN